jgi:RNA polymerase sigma factor (sigma-70 family)
MATNRTAQALEHLRQAALLQQAGGLPDGQLLGRFVDHGDEAAFAALLRRHGPMVWGVCRRLLPHHDAEEAFQATLLVLARKAAAVRPRGMVANWLYGVAQRVALQARRTAARRRARERQVTPLPEPGVAGHEPWHDLLPWLDQELARLPEKYRVAIVLCDLEGTTRKEAARQLGCPEGTLAARVARGRALLARRLARQGLILPAGAVVAVLSRQAVSASVPPAVMSSAIKAASVVAAGPAAGVVPARVAALAKGALQVMVLSKLKVVAAAVAAVAVVALGGGLLSRVPGTAEAAAPPPTALAPPGGQGDAANGHEALKNKLLTLEKAWIAADGRPGTDTYGQFLADDFVHVAPNGEKSDKAGNLRAHGGHHVGADYRMSDVELIRLNEQAAILTYRIACKIISNATGQAVAERNSVTPRRGCSAAAAGSSSSRRVWTCPRCPRRTPCCLADDRKTIRR